MDEGWVKIFRSLLKWEWHDEPKMMSIWVHLLLMANHDDMKWHGEVIQRGQVVTTRKGLSLEVGISEQSVRTCLIRLEESQMITRKSTNESTNRKTIITISNYCKFQDVQNENQPTSQPTNNQPTTNLTRMKENNNIYSLSLNSAHARENELNVEVARKVLMNEQYLLTIFRQHREDINSLKQGVKDYLDINVFKTWETEGDIRDHFLKWWRKDHPVTAPPQRVPTVKEKKIKAEEEEIKAREEAETRAHKERVRVMNEGINKIMAERGCDWTEARKIYSQLKNQQHGKEI